jgi:capsule polysaccharide export protein KpsE/RkpR
MTSLQDQLIAIEARLDDLYAAHPNGSALITSVEARAVSLRERLILAETQRGVLSISIS